jgi:cytochrome c peroxidase
MILLKRRVGRHLGVMIGLFMSAVGTFGAAAFQHQEPIVPIALSPSVDSGRAAIGERLFNDVGLSGQKTHACASCHLLDRGGVDGLQNAVRLDGTRLRNTPTVFNASLNSALNWDGVVSTLEDHTDRIVPTLMNISWPQLIARLRGDGTYASVFAAAYGERPTHANVLDAVATFERSLLTPNSRFDRYLRGQPDALTTREKDGYALFKSYGCVSCHQGVNIGGNVFQQFGVFYPVPPGRSQIRDAGRFLVTRVPRDEHVFRVPSLRNVAVSAPYFHDGRAATLEEAVETMGKVQLARSLTAKEIGPIVDFLKTLTGEYRGRLLTAPQPEGR